MNRDSNLIFEAYKNKLLNELSPISMSGDINLEPIKKKTLPGQGKKYGAGAIKEVAKSQGKSEEEVTQDMAKTIIAKAGDKKEIDGKMVHYFSGEPETFINSLVPEFKQKYGIPPTMGRYTINYLLIYVLDAEKTSGGLTRLSTKNISNPETLPDQPVSVDKKFPSLDEGYGSEYVYYKNSEARLDGVVKDIFEKMADEIDGEDMASTIKRNMILAGVDRKQFWNIVENLLKGQAYFEKIKNMRMDDERDVPVGPMSTSRRDIEDTVRELPAFRELQRQKARETSY